MTRRRDLGIKFDDLREYLAREGYVLETIALPDTPFQVYRHIPPHQPYRRQYATLYNALRFNGPGGAEEDVIRRFEEWRLKRFVNGAP